MCANATPTLLAYGSRRRANCGSSKTVIRASASNVLVPTVASVTCTPRARSSGTSVATTFSIPPYPSGGTGSIAPPLDRDM